MAAKTGILPSNEEQFAYDLVSDDLGVQVSHHDTGLRPGGGMVDGLIHLADGTSAALEVITDADGEVMALWRAIEKKGNTFNIAGLANGWYVHVNRSTRINKLKPQLAAFLQRLERLKVGSTLDLMPSRYWPNADVFGEMNRIGVTSATAHSVNPGDVHLVPVAWSGSAGVGFAPLVEWIDAMFNDNLDVPTKLAKHEDATERHAFIWATSSSPYGLIYILKNSDPVWGAPVPTSQTESRICGWADCEPIWERSPGRQLADGDGQHGPGPVVPGSWLTRRARQRTSDLAWIPLCGTDVMSSLPG